MTPKDKIVIKLNPLNRALALILFVSQLVAYVWFLCFYLHYMVGPFTSLFSTPSLGDKNEGQFSPVWNGLMYSSFFVQHVIMATFVFKRSVLSFLPSYPLYERFIYNTVSAFCFVYPFTLVKLAYIPVFELNSYVAAVGAVLGDIFFIGSMVQLSMNLYAPYSLKQLLTKDTLVLENYGNKQAQGLKSSYFYGICRHPMQLGIMMGVIFSDANYTADRIQFAIVMVTWILIAIYYEEKRTQATFKDYEQYCKKVKYQLIPFIY